VQVFQVLDQLPVGLLKAQLELKAALDGKGQLTLQLPFLLQTTDRRQHGNGSQKML